jgi:hypothetical protein
MKKEHLYALLFSIALAVFLYLQFGFVFVLFIPPFFYIFLKKGNKKNPLN